MKLRDDLPRLITECRGNPLSLSHTDFVTDYFMWLALLFVVCDALRESNFALPSSLQNEINPHRRKLKEFRNAIFHVRSKFRSSEYLALAERPDFLESMSRIHFGLRDWFKEEMKRALIQSGCEERVADFVAALSRGQKYPHDP